jgi:hypothetical protein
MIYYTGIMLDIVHYMWCILYAWHFEGCLIFRSYNDFRAQVVFLL